MSNNLLSLEDTARQALLSLFGKANQPQLEQGENNAMNNAARTMYRYRNARTVQIAGDNDGSVCMVEDVPDPDGRVYRMEYKSTPNGQHALAWCRSNPWDRSHPNAGVGYATGHVKSEGMLCLGDDHGSTYSSSPYNIETVIRRARYWCIAFSVLKESGTFPQP